MSPFRPPKSPTRRRKGPLTPLTQEDRALWRLVTRDVKPLKRRQGKALGRPKTRPDLPSGAAAVEEHPRLSSSSAAAERALSSRSTAGPSSQGLDPALRRRLRRGRQRLDAALDLHGLTQGEAHYRLRRFLEDSAARGHRLVLVITGKGRGGETGVLRRLVPYWLAEPALAARVVGFETAHARHGGTGALYVRLRRPSGGGPS